MPIEYQRDIPLDASDDLVEAIREHVRDTVAAQADADDDPATRAEDVRVWTEKHPEKPKELQRIRGYLDAEPDAPYLKPDFDPWAGVDPALREEVLGGQV
jgi:hypothetical protein